MAVEMILCKFCRKGIEKSVAVRNGDLIHPWIHLSGTYYCMTPEVNMPAPADTRWEYVSSSISFDPRYNGIFIFTLSVVADGWYVNNVKHYPAIDVMSRQPGVYDLTGQILDEMVIEVDDELMLHGSVREYLFYGKEVPHE